MYKYRPRGVCSREMNFDIDDNGVITYCEIIGGCSGNTQGICSLVKGMKAEDAIKKMKGIRCGMKPSSCPDQLSIALEEAIEKTVQ